MRASSGTDQPSMLRHWGFFLRDWFCDSSLGSLFDGRRFAPLKWWSRSCTRRKGSGYSMKSMHFTNPFFRLRSSTYCRPAKRRWNEIRAAPIAFDRLWIDIETHSDRSCNVGETSICVSSAYRFQLGAYWTVHFRKCILAKFIGFSVQKEHRRPKHEAGKSGISGSLL